MKSDKCYFCSYLSKYKDKDFSDEINSAVVLGSKYKEVLQLFENSKIFNHSQKPSKHFMEKHKFNCLENFKPIEKKIVQTIIKENDIVTIETGNFIYTDYNNKPTEEVRKDLKDRWLKIGCKLTDIIDHRLNNLNHTTKDNGNVKETVTVLKTILDLMYYDNVKIVNSEASDSASPKNFRIIFED